MQIDGHHTMTYIAARLAGFSKPKASIIAYSAQYVDDATNSGVIKFDNEAMYQRISSAHRMLDYRNSDELDTCDDQQARARKRRQTGGTEPW